MEAVVLQRQYCPDGHPEEQHCATTLLISRLNPSIMAIGLHIVYYNRAAGVPLEIVSGGEARAGNLVFRDLSCEDKLRRKPHQPYKTVCG